MNRSFRTALVLAAILALSCGRLHRKALQVTQALWMSGAMERAGVYDVTVSKPGYLDWTGTAVVEADACHVHTVTLQVRLDPQT